MTAKLISPEMETFPHLQRRRNALPDILDGCTVPELEAVYNSLDNIAMVLQVITSPRSSPERGQTTDEVVETHDSLNESAESLFHRSRRLLQRRNAIVSENVLTLLASEALRNNSH